MQGAVTSRLTSGTMASMSIKPKKTLPRRLSKSSASSHDLQFHRSANRRRSRSKATVRCTASTANSLFDDLASRIEISTDEDNSSRASLSFGYLRGLEGTFDSCRIAMVGASVCKRPWNGLEDAVMSMLETSFRMVDGTLVAGHGIQWLGIADSGFHLEGLSVLWVEGWRRHSESSDIGVWILRFSSSRFIHL